MAVTVGTVTTDAGEAAGESSASFSATIDAGSDRIVVVATHTADDGAGTNVTDVTIAGVSCTFLDRSVSGTQAHVEFWYMLEANLPGAGSSTVVVEWGGATDRGGVTVINFAGVDQTTPVGTHQTSAGVDDPSVNVSASTDDMVVDAMAHRRGDVQTVSAGPDQTERSNFVAGGTDTTSVVCATSTEPGAATVTMSWTTGGAGNALIAVPLLQANGGGGGGGITLPLLHAIQES